VEDAIPRDDRRSLNSPAGPRSTEIVAAALLRGVQLDAANPAEEWKHARPVSFCLDWQEKNPDPARETQVRVLWSEEVLYLRFDCRYRELSVFSEAEPDGRCDHLWDRDVAEAFLQPDPSVLRSYKEFEVAPNGFWIDFDVSSDGFQDLKGGLQRSICIDEANHTWAAELAIPMASMTTNFDPTSVWRANFYRVEGSAEPRAYYAWQPTNTSQPNFHVPSAFGRLRFDCSGSAVGRHRSV
jgi:alpha-galactosidase